MQQILLTLSVLSFAVIFISYGYFKREKEGYICLTHPEIARAVIIWWLKHEKWAWMVLVVKMEALACIRVKHVTRITRKRMGSLTLDVNLSKRIIFRFDLLRAPRGLVPLFLRFQTFTTRITLVSVHCISSVLFASRIKDWQTLLRNTGCNMYSRTLPALFLNFVR